MPDLNRSGRAVGLESSPWAPLGQRAFAALWLGVLVSNMGTYMQTLGAQWLLIDSPDAVAIVALVQAASTLPIMLLAIPAGVLADVFDRRWVLFVVQVYFLVVSGCLLFLTIADLMPPVLLLTFTFLLGVGAGVRAVFALNLLSIIPLGIALLFWHRTPTIAPGARERFWSALRAGTRYAWHETSVRRIMLRIAVFVFPAASMWALLPLIASQRLGLDAGGYGLLFAALGAGAVLGALVLGRARRYLSSNATLTVSGIVMAAALALLVAVHSPAGAAVVLIVAGLSWTSTISTLVAELQLLLPTWVVARGMAVWTMVFTGAQAVGAIVWGVVAQQAGLVPTFIVAAGLALVFVGLGLGWRIDDAGQTDSDPAVYWSQPRVFYDIEPADGPILIAIRYTITEDKQVEWLSAMRGLRRSRLRTGATRWELYRDAGHGNEFVEQFRVATWAEHQRQHDGRLTVGDQRIERRALSFSDPPAAAQHLLPPQPHSEPADVSGVQEQFTVDAHPPAPR